VRKADDRVRGVKSHSDDIDDRERFGHKDTLRKYGCSASGNRGLQVSDNISGNLWR
jgi:hypothetical protein